MVSIGNSKSPKSENIISFYYLQYIYKNEDEKIFQEESIEILKIMALIENI